MSLEEEIRSEQARNDGLVKQIESFMKLLPPNPDWYDPGDKMELEKLWQEKEESDQRLAALKPPMEGNVSKPMVWIGNKRAWGDMIVTSYRGGLIQATSALDALEQAAEHFVWKDTDRPDMPPEPFKPRSVWQSLKNRDDYQDPQKPGPR